MTPATETLEARIAEWRGFVAARHTVDEPDVQELESHLREQIADLDAAGLAGDEAFLIAVKRMGDVDAISQEFAREHSGRLWKQLVVGTGDDGSDPSAAQRWREVVAIAVAAAVAIQAVRLAPAESDGGDLWILRNVALLVLPFLVAYFARIRSLSLPQLAVAATPVVLSAVFMNAYPFDADATTAALAAAHVPAVLWCSVAFAYMGGAWRSQERRMDVVRFTGEWFIYYVLLALGGGVLTALTALVLDPVADGLGESVIGWVLPAGAAGAVVVAAALVESKQRIVENMAPVLTLVFTPLFAGMLALSAIVYAATGLGGAFDRELLGVFDALLVVVLGLVLYGMSARDATTTPGWIDRIQLVAVVSALALDLMVLLSMVGRIGDLGFTPNRAVALGFNLVLLGNLAGAAWLSGRFLAGRSTFHRLERWQTNYLPVFGLWAAFVVVVVPVVFGFA